MRGELNRWESSLTENNYIHINALEKGYENDAFLVLFSCIHNYLKQLKFSNKDLAGFVDESKKFLINVAKATMKFGINILVDKTVGAKNCSDLASDLLDTYCDDILNASLERENLNNALKSKLKKLQTS